MSLSQWKVGWDKEAQLLIISKKKKKKNETKFDGHVF